MFRDIVLSKYVDIYIYWIWLFPEKFFLSSGRKYLVKVIPDQINLLSLF